MGKTGTNEKATMIVMLLIKHAWLVVSGFNIMKVGFNLGKFTYRLFMFRL